MGLVPVSKSCANFERSENLTHLKVIGVVVDQVVENPDAVKAAPGGPVVKVVVPQVGDVVGGPEDVAGAVDAVRALDLLDAAVAERLGPGLVVQGLLGGGGQGQSGQEKGERLHDSLGRRHSDGGVQAFGFEELMRGVTLLVDDVL